MLLKSICHYYLELKMSAQKHADGFRSQFIIIRLRTRGLGPFSSLKKNKAKKKPVQGM